MELTFAEFKKLISLYQKNLLTNEDLVYEDVIVPFSSVVEVASIYEDSTIEIDEKNYLIESIYDSLIDPTPSPIDMYSIESEYDVFFKLVEKERKTSLSEIESFFGKNFIGTKKFEEILHKLNEKNIEVINDFELTAQKKEFDEKEKFNQTYILETHKKREAYASLPIFFEPNIDSYSFKKLLIENGYAERIVYYENGDIETIPWTINRLDINSNLLANIRSYHKFRDWESKGIEKIIIKTDAQHSEIKKVDNEQTTEEQNLTDKDLESLILFSTKFFDELEKQEKLKEKFNDEKMNQPAELNND